MTLDLAPSSAIAEDRLTSNLAEYGEMAERRRRGTTSSMNGASLRDDMTIFVSYATPAATEASISSSGLRRGWSYHSGLGTSTSVGYPPSEGHRLQPSQHFGSGYLGYSITDAVPGANQWQPLFRSTDTSAAAGAHASQIWTVLQEASQLVSHGDARPTPASLASLVALLKRFGSGTTPAAQIAATPSGSFELMWLRRGLVLSFILGEDGSLYCWSERPDGKEQFEYEASHPDTLTAEAIQAIWSVLQSMSADAAVAPARA